jgi:hypothetical protein
MTQTLIIHVIRTNKIPFLQSRASWPLTVTTLSIRAFGMWLPYSPLAPSLGLAHLPRMYWPSPDADAGWICELNANNQNLVNAEEMDLNSSFGGRSCVSNT